MSKKPQPYTIQITAPNGEVILQEALPIEPKHTDAGNYNYFLRKKFKEEKANKSFVLTMNLTNTIEKSEEEKQAARDAKATQKALEKVMELDDEAFAALLEKRKLAASK